MKFPDIFKEFPDYGAEFPDISREFPDISGEFPDYERAKPDIFEEFPDYAGTKPDSAEEFPDSYSPMERSFVSRRKSAPTATVMSATAIGYQRPA